jgi:hypothetical protein
VSAEVHALAERNHQPPAGPITEVHDVTSASEVRNRDLDVRCVAGWFDQKERDWPVAEDLDRIANEAGKNGTGKA